MSDKDFSKADQDLSNTMIIMPKEMRDKIFKKRTSLQISMKDTNNKMARRRTLNARSTVFPKQGTSPDFEVPGPQWQRQSQFRSRNFSARSSGRTRSRIKKYEKTPSHSEVMSGARGLTGCAGEPETMSVKGATSSMFDSTNSVVPEASSHREHPSESTEMIQRNNENQQATLPELRIPSPPMKAIVPKFEESDSDHACHEKHYTPLDSCSTKKIVLEKYNEKHACIHESILQQEYESYCKNKNKFDQRDGKALYERDTFTKFFKSKYVRVKKYKYAITDLNVDQCQLDSFIRLSPDGKELEIYNQYLEQKPTGFDAAEDVKERKQQLVDELPQNAGVFYYKKSSSSCHLSDIKSFTYGGSTSRFWMYRKHLISQRRAAGLQMLPFYTWECITLHLSHRDIFLVIRDEQNMRQFIQLLVANLDTIDGQRNSAAGVRAALWRQETGRRRVGPKEKGQIKVKIEADIRRVTNLKYLILKVRQKIGFEAFRQKKTTLELLAGQILRTQNILVKHGDIEGQSHSQQAMKVMDAFASSHLSGCFRMLIQLNGLIGNAPTVGAELYETEFDSAHETVYVKKKGDHVARKKVINHAANQANYQKVRMFFEKSKCADFFQHARVGNHKLYQRKSSKQMIDARIKRKIAEDLYMKLKLLIQLKAVHGEVYLHVLLRLINLCKQMVVSDLENGQEVYIPDEISVDKLPDSYRYYDPILNIIQTDISEDAREKIHINDKMSLEMYISQKSLFKKLLEEKMGGGKQETQYEIIKQTNMVEINPIKSPHTMCVQKSRYVEIKQDFSEKVNQQGQYLAFCDEIDLNLMFCKPKEVNQKHRKFLVYKGAFLAKLYLLRAKYYKITLMMRLQKWIETHLDTLYNKVNRQKLQHYSNIKTNGQTKFKEFKTVRIYKDKITFKENLLEMFEKIVDQKLERNNYRRLMDLKGHMDNNAEYQHKNTFVEKSIEKRIRFLNPTQIQRVKKKLAEIYKDDLIRNNSDYYHEMPVSVESNL